MSNVITGLFATSVEASEAIHVLESMGMTQEDISIVANDSYQEDDFGVTDGSKAAEGAIIGAASSGVLSAIVAGLAAVGTVASGGVGIIASGPMVAALATDGAGAAAGGTVGAVVAAHIPEHEVKFFEDAINKGSILIGVRFNSDNKEAIKTVLSDAGAAHVSTA